MILFNNIYMGAGILPVAMHNGKLYFLFGKEHNGADTPGWSDFGGGTEKKESPFTTAIREGYEELSGFFGTKANIKKIVTQNLICSIKSKNYTTFIFEHEYCREMPKYFNRNFNFMKKHASHIIAKKGLYEKCEIRWFTIDDIKKNRKEFRSYYDIEFLDAIISEESNIINSF